MKYIEVQKQFDQIEQLIKIEGYSDKQLIKHLDIASSTFYKWKNEKSEFSELLKNSKEKLVNELQKGLFKTALGYEYTETTKETKTLTNGDTIIIEKEVTKHSSPNVTALVFALSNLDPKNFKRQDKPTIETNEDDTQLETLSIDEIKEKRKQRAIRNNITRIPRI